MHDHSLIRHHISLDEAPWCEEESLSTFRLIVDSYLCWTYYLLQMCLTFLAAIFHEAHLYLSLRGNCQARRDKKTKNLSAPRKEMLRRFMLSPKKKNRLLRSKAYTLASLYSVEKSKLKVFTVLGLWCRSGMFSSADLEVQVPHIQPLVKCLALFRACWFIVKAMHRPSLLPCDCSVLQYVTQQYSASRRTSSFTDPPLLGPSMNDRGHARVYVGLLGL